MRDKLIKLLGGRTDAEYDFLEQEYQNQRALALMRKDQVDYFDKRFNEERVERQRLQEIIFKNYGVVTSETPSPGIDKDNELHPISSSRPSWNNLRRKLEQDDRARVIAELGNKVEEPA